MKKGRKISLVEPLGVGGSLAEVTESGLVREVREVRGKKGLSEHLRLGLCKVADNRSREEILGEPLSRFEINKLVKPHMSHNRQVNLGTVLLLIVRLLSFCDSVHFCLNQWHFNLCNL
jgi:hypothetical protein